MNLDPNGCVDQPGCFPMFFSEDCIYSCSKTESYLHCGEFPLEFRIADVTPIPRGPLSALVPNSRPISITPVLSKVFERLISSRFGRFSERSRLLPSHQYSYRKNLGTCDALLDIVSQG